MSHSAELPLILGSDSQAKDAYRDMLAKTVEAILASIGNDAAYQGLTPQQLQQQVASVDMLPAQGLGYESVLRKMEEMVLPNFLRTWSPDYMAHLHSPALMETIASELILSTFNQSMDSWDQAPVATEIEVQVIKRLCSLYGYATGSDGVFTSGGSQSNLCAITAARDWYCSNFLGHDVKKLGLPAEYRKLRLYTSAISHFSMEKSAHLLGLGYDAVVKVPVDSQCRMDIDALKALVQADLEAGNLPMCVVATIGTTDFGSIDNVDAIRPICDLAHMWLHADAAYGSAAILSPTYRGRLGNLSLCDSITVDFHKMFLLPISCSAVLVKDGSALDVFTLHADYLNREEDEEDGYTNLVGKSIQTTRRFDALKVWVAFQVRGADGFASLIDTVIGNAAYLYDILSADSQFKVAVKPELSSVVFRLVASDEVNKRVRRSLMHHEGTVIGQTVYDGKTFLKFTLLNPAITHGKLEHLLQLIKRIGAGA